MIIMTMFDRYEGEADDVEARGCVAGDAWHGDTVG